MPVKPLVLQPGVNTQATQLLNGGGWSASNRVRWRDGGYLEKLGGWQQLFATLIGGLCRGLHAYQGLENDDYLLIGSNDAMQVYFDGTLYDFILGSAPRNLPLTLSGGWLVSTALSSTYTVTDPANGRVAGDLVRIIIPVSVGGVTLFPQTVTVAHIIDADHYTFVGNKTAVSDDTFGGLTPLFQVFINESRVDVSLVGSNLNDGDIFTVQFGLTIGGVTIAAGNYRVEALDADNFRLSVAPQIATSTTQAYENQLAGAIPFPQGQLSYVENVPTVNNWFLDNFGNIALLCFENGPIFTWTPPISDGLFASGLAPPAPQASAGMFVAMPQAQIITFGAEINGIQDALLLRWCDAGDYSVWTADADNQAGSFRLSRGSKIVGALQAPTVTMVWTDIDMWLMQYIGLPFIYSFNIMGSGCGLIAPRAATIIHNVTYWMSQKQFFMFASGSVQPLPCPVWDVVFNDLDQDNVAKCFAGSNSAFSEVLFFYPSKSGGTGECDSYVKVQVNSQLWDFGKLDRTAWIDQTVFGPPIGADTARAIQQHEIGYDANGAAMDGVYIESGFVDMGAGASDILFIDQIVPDLKWFGDDGFVILTLFLQQYPGGATIMQGPFTVTAKTRFVSLRIRARLVSFKIAWGEVPGFSARLGAITYRENAMGRRP